ncbi:amino acid ABC transporter permease [Cohaesibacter celericrescens]|uniref:Glutamate/aspartate import permease protein GltK n=1 Tax=Cohaesibacter celericrescens TaxID=2067669 RepID=A0A2N5XMM2_9HYPH|nr:amino acid ABC transporter permease [Cohaesibacter celericrescens]PLW75688.1 amino acid ABC transporter [Cohaesibacter celericrescens]
MSFSFDTIWQNLPYMLTAARWTILISVAGMAISLIWGTFLCAARLSQGAITRRAAMVYISFFRGVPLLVQLLMFYYMLPFIGLDLPAIQAAILAVGLCSAAYTAEILRGAIQSIPAGQTEAAEALGIPRFSLWRRILVPQAVRIGLPSLVNELILLVKVSSLASVVGIGELTRISQNITGQTYRPLEIYLAAAAIYFIINWILSVMGRLVEKKLQVG